MLHITYYILHITYYILHITYYLLHITYYILHIKYYILHSECGHNYNVSTTFSKLIESKIKNQLFSYAELW